MKKAVFCVAVALALAAARAELVVYPDYPEKALAFIDRERPAVMASSDFYHPAYAKVFGFRYMGTDYSLWLPAETED